MSFSMTTPQILTRKKDVTRRLGWWFLEHGTVVQAIEKGQGLKKGEKVNRLCRIRILSTRVERLGDMADSECAREGFPEMRAADFIDMFCKHNKCTPAVKVNRIEFEYDELLQ